MHKGILGAIAGDIIGSSHEMTVVNTLKFKLFQSSSTFTDDTCLTVAVADCMLNANLASDMRQYLIKWGQSYPNAHYGHSFKRFIKGADVEPSKGNGAPMRVPTGGQVPCCTFLPC